MTGVLIVVDLQPNFWGASALPPIDADRAMAAARARPNGWPRPQWPLGIPAVVTEEDKQRNGPHRRIGAQPALGARHAGHR